MVITKTVKTTVPENAETALSLIKGEIYKNINCGLYNRNIAVSKAAYYVSYRLMRNGAKPKLTNWFAKQLIECVIGVRELPETWEKATFKALHPNKLTVTVTSNSHEDKTVIKACLEWLGRRAYSFKQLRSDIGFFATKEPPKLIQKIAKAFYYERALDLREPSEKDFIQLASWAYFKGVSDVIEERSRRK